MFNKLANRMRNDRGATDPILIIAGIAVSLILLVGGSFAVQGIITNGKDLNAKSDLDKVAVAEVAYYAENDAYVAYAKDANTVLEDSGVGFHPTEGTGTNLIVELEGDGWNSASRSASGKVFLRSSESNLSVTFSAAITPTELTKLGMTQAEAAALAAKV